MDSFMHGFKNWLTENFGDYHNFSGLKPYLQYKTEDGHKIHVHVFNNPKGKHAVFYNKNLETVTKLVHWNHESKHPSEDELKNAGKDKEDLKEEHDDLSPDSAGKIAEHATAIYLHGHKHEQAGTFGSDAHKKDIAEHEKHIEALGKGKDPKAVELRKEHGRAIANAVMEHVKLKHGPKATIVNVGHTSKAGDIGRFTKGKHNDSQENPSDVAVEIKGSELAKDKESVHEGYSLKSSGKSNKITAKNPAIHMHGELDHPTRKFGAETISREGIKKDVLKPMGAHDKKAVDRGRMLDDARKKEGVRSMSSLEAEANEKGRNVKRNIAKELHDHVHHLLTKTGDEGHRMVGKMLQHHLTADTSMPWSKVHAQGSKTNLVRATVQHGSESPMKNVLANKKTKFAVSHSGERVTIHKVEKDGSHTPLAHYSPKTKSNVFKSDVHGWNVLPGSAH